MPMLTIPPPISRRVMPIITPSEPITAQARSTLSERMSVPTGTDLSGKRQSIWPRPIWRSLLPTSLPASRSSGTPLPALQATTFTAGPPRATGMGSVAFRAEPPMPILTPLPRNCPQARYAIIRSGPFPRREFPSVILSPQAPMPSICPSPAE